MDDTAHSPYERGTRGALRRLGLPHKLAQALLPRAITPTRAVETARAVRLPSWKTMGALGALAGGAALAHQVAQTPTVEVHPSLPMRTMFA